MIPSLDLKQLSAPQRAELIYSQARSELSDRLWRAALGDGRDRDGGASPLGDGRMGLDALIALLQPDAAEGAQRPALAEPRTLGAEPASLDIADIQVREHGGPDFAADQTASDPSDRPITSGLGPNARYEPNLNAAAARTGIPASALAAIVHAEAAKGRDGSWQLLSRNPRSSAAGLGQFLSGTWEGMAESRGTWLNAVARDKGWLDDRGCVIPAARSSLLSLRYDANASINTIADYARQNLDGLKRAGVKIGSDAEGIAQSAYLGHHLGLGDAIRFAKGGIPPARARMLLGAQIGSAEASQRIAAAGCPTTAHREWFLSYVKRNVQPDRFCS